MMRLKPIIISVLLIICFSCKNNTKDDVGTSFNNEGNEEKSICASCGKETNWGDAYYWTYNENMSPQDKLSILQIGTTENFSDENGEIHKGIGSEMPYYNNGKYIKGVFCSYQCAQNDSNRNNPQNSTPEYVESNNTEECRTCGKILNIPTSRNCTWCNKVFDGWSPNEHSCTYVIECSAKDDSERDFQFNIHNGCDWKVEDRHFCSLKCVSEYNNR
ncbi:hypothetical protein [Flavobacterium chungnamense]|uniref:Uncharacterized protein n=1 Tax=Flavobacterium chungnamense TaxID=706182 RepID=A0ABP7V219_9FLAO